MGIPYAAAPVNEKRWVSPQPVHPWTGTRDATNPGPACTQPEAPDMPSSVPQSEDCLTVDVTAPAGSGKNRPVMVWIPGGGFITGAGSIYDPTRLAQTGDIVVVTVNYRLGVYGFFAHPELGDSNFGLQDQVAALRWVRTNIAEFGGDPTQVTLAGASAGAMSACTLMTTPQARNLFHRAIIQSGSCLTSHPAGALGDTAFGEAAPLVEQRYPAHEFTSPTAATSRVFSDRDWICASWKSGRDHAVRAPTYAYTFTDPTAPTPGGNPVPTLVQPATVHGSDMYSLFDFPDGPPLTTAQRSLADRLVGYWTRFVRTGNPNGGHAPAWPQLGESDLALALTRDAIQPFDMRTTHHCDLRESAWES
ncbi:carboxylesterase family protein [Nocardia iowensis]|uniref:Carboxylic ester hydrolase n=1 Tax=Nocardia iowensis TaxID=204891 RepID=A0ABX8RXP3_NOCIO|nr:carboxylesterase family protein [Nocardia iowensis]QXN93140.1 carboxylesterase family protein [Nocardia iowensis]